MAHRFTQTYNVAAFFAALIVGCGPDAVLTGTPTPGDEDGIQCLIDIEDIFDGGVGKDGIPALTNPEFVAPSDESAQYISTTDRVVGLVTDGQAYAVPHNILYFHEIVNLRLGETDAAVTYCPLTGSSVVFDRSAIGGSEFGVSGLLFRNNLILYDRNEEESLWPQLMLGAACGPRRRTSLPLLPMMEVRWGAWLELYPETQILAKPAGFGRTYTENPLVEYERVDNTDIPNTIPIDTRRPPKERVIGAPASVDGGTAFPMGELSKRGAQAIPTRVPDDDATLFWNTEARGGAIYLNTVSGQVLSFRAVSDDIFDNETNSRWGIHGLALEGPLAGTQLTQYSDAYTAFWFAWADFQPETIVWVN